MKLNTQRGFTLIELLVVIAIIGILASVVLASLNSARSKGADAAIKSSINNARSQAELYYDSNNSSYDPTPAGSGGGWVCSDTTITNISTSVNSAGGSFDCDAIASAYRMISRLVSTSSYYCVDSTGIAKTTTASGTASATVCP